MYALKEVMVMMMMMMMMMMMYLKLTNKPCAVSGLKNPTELPSGPIVVLNIRLKGNGFVIALSLLVGDLALYLISISCNSSAEYASA